MIHHTMAGYKYRTAIGERMPTKKNLIIKILLIFVTGLIILVVAIFLVNYKSVSNRYQLDTDSIAHITIIYMRTPNVSLYDVPKDNFTIYINALKTRLSKEIEEVNLQKDDKLNYLGADAYIVRYHYTNGKYFDIRTGDSRYKTIVVDMSNYFNDNVNDYFYIHQTFSSSIFEEKFLEDVLIKASKSLKEK